MGDKLLAEARRGNRGAVSLLLNRHRETLCAWAERAVQECNPTAADPTVIVERTIHQAHDQFGDFHGETDGEWVDWLRSLLERNVGCTILASPGTLGDRDPAQAAPPQAGGSEASVGAPGGSSADKTQSDRLEQAISSLPAAQAHVLRLRQFNGWTLKRIAEHVGVDEIIVAALLRTGLRQLCERLDAEDVGES